MKRHVNIRIKSRNLIRKIKVTASEKGISQTDLAKKTRISQSNINRWFLYKQSPSLINFIKLAEAVGLRLTIKKVTS